MAAFATFASYSILLEYIAPHRSRAAARKHLLGAQIWCGELQWHNLWKLKNLKNFIGFLRKGLS